MALSLHEMPHSPFCIPISRMLDAAGVPFDRVNVPNWDRRAVLELTGGRYYQVPVLVHDGRVIFESAGDSQDVARYVDHTFCGGRLFPKEQEGLQQILISHLENDVEGVTFRLTDIHYIPTIASVCERGMVIRHKERKFGPGCVDAWRRDQESLRAQAEGLLARFDGMLGGQHFLLGERPLYTDFLLYGIVGNYTFNGWNELPERMPALIEWTERMSAFRF
jgi:glutathione S-transferase